MSIFLKISWRIFVYLIFHIYSSSYGHSIPPALLLLISTGGFRFPPPWQVFLSTVEDSISLHLSSYLCPLQRIPFFHRLFLALTNVI